MSQFFASGNQNIGASASASASVLPVNIQDYPLRYSWASVVAQMVKNTPAMLDTWVPSMDWDLLEKGMATHSSILAWRIHEQRSCQATVLGVAKSQTRLSDFSLHFHFMAFS